MIDSKAHPSRRTGAHRGLHAAVFAALLSTPLLAPAQVGAGTQNSPFAPLPQYAPSAQNLQRVVNPRQFSSTPSVVAEPPVLNLSTQAHREVVDDTAVTILFVERTGAEPAPLQASVNSTLQDALARLRHDPALQVRSGTYFTRPRYGRDGRIEGWTVHGELIAESADPAAISRAAATAGGQLNVGSLGFLLSAARRAQTERELTVEAATRLRERALETARALGYSGVDLLEASLDSGLPRPPVMLARAGSIAAAPSDAIPLPVEPGRSQVTVSFSGTFRLLK